MDTSGNIMETSRMINNTNISQIETMILDYNENIRYYNRNLRDMLDMYREGITDERERRVERQRRFNTNRYTNWNNNWNRNNIINNDIINNDFIDRYIPRNNLFFMETQLNDLHDIIVRPTNLQIETATESINYDFSMQHHQCPISLEQFEQDESICRIKHCGHLFKSTSLMNWFERNVRCPVCRYDIRQYREREREEREEREERQEREREDQRQERQERRERQERQEDQIQESDVPPSRTIRSNLISNIVRNLITDEMNRTPNLNTTINDFLVTFNIPFALDISYNDSY